MKKKLLSIFLSAALIAAMLVGCGGSSSTPTESDATEKSTEAAVSPENSGEKVKIGILSVLNITEDEYLEMNNARVKAIKIVAGADSTLLDSEMIFYDNLDAMHMALEKPVI